MKRLDREINDRLRKVLRGLKKMWTKYGIFFIAAIIVWLSPSWLSFFIPGLKPFALKWIALVISPIMPSWAAVPLLSVILKLLFIGLMWLIRKIKDWIRKAGFGARLVALADVDEVEVILHQLEHMKILKDTKYAEFRKNLKEDRMKLITEYWEPTIEEAEGGPHE